VQVVAYSVNSIETMSICTTKQCDVNDMQVFLVKHASLQFIYIGITCANVYYFAQNAEEGRACIA
jgi:hypothetical protein